MQALICANYGTPCGNFMPCKGSWCPECYSRHPLDDYDIFLPKEEDDELVRDDDDTRFTQARLGDNLVVPFQCDLCQFRNMWYRDPLPEDKFALMVIRRCILDIFWAREEGTVYKNWLEVNRLMRLQESYGLRLVMK